MQRMLMLLMLVFPVSLQGYRIGIGMQTMIPVRKKWQLPPKAHPPSLPPPPPTGVSVSAEQPAAVPLNHSIELNSELATSFMSYAMSTILSRALPDVRDGLKPVHRRVLYAMNSLSLGPDSSHRKCARVVGEVLGKFHPHGDQSVYDALVRMAQDFVMLQPLVSGHGNFGSVDNDPAAAMRYTECRLSSFSQESLLVDIKENTVDFVPNFDGNEKEPLVLPARLPTLLLNGASGIAVGMATSIPPHNLGEVVDAMIALIRNPNLTDEELLKIIPAPDFPTGGQIFGLDDVHKMYKTGHGRVLMRAKCHIEIVGGVGGSRGRNAIIVSELPYMTNKAALLENIAHMVDDKKLEGISDLRDESDRSGIRIVIELKRDAVPAVVQNNLFKKTALQTTFSGNMLALTDSGAVPRRLSLRQLLRMFIDFRYETIRRRTRNQLNKLENRAHIVSGMLCALGRIDDIIALIRTNTGDSMSVKRELMLPQYNFTAEQADAIMGLTLRRLTALEESKLNLELKDLNSHIEQASQIMLSSSKVYSIIEEESLALKSKHGKPRKSVILASEEAVLQDEDLIPNDRSVIIITSSGYIKRVPLGEFETQQRGGRGRLAVGGTSPVISEIRRMKTRGLLAGYQEDGTESEIEGFAMEQKLLSRSHSGHGDQVAHLFTCNNHDSVLFFTDRGIAYKARAFNIPLSSRTARGVPLPQVLPISVDEAVTSTIPVSSFIEEDKSLILLTANGFLKKTPLRAFESVTARGLTVVSLSEGDLLKWARLSMPGQEVILATRRGFAGRFPESDVPSTSRTSKGLRALSLRPGDRMADMDLYSPPIQSSYSADSMLTQVDKASSGKDRKEHAHSLYEEALDTVCTNSNADATVTKVKTQTPSFALLVTEKGYGKRILIDELVSKKRGGKGTMVIKFKAPSAQRKMKGRKLSQNLGSVDDAVVALRVCPTPRASLVLSDTSSTKIGAPKTSSGHAVLSTNYGKVLKFRVRDIVVQSRSATGVLLQNTDNIHGDECIVSADIVSD